MKRWISMLIGWVALLFLVGTAAAQAPEPPVPIQPQHTDPLWQATYWNNRGMEGEPVLQRSETYLNYEWGAGAPAGGISADNFSVRWTKYVDVPAGIYRFVSTSDDGMRVWLDNDLIVNDWTDHGATTHVVNKYMSAGHHLVSVEYYENSGEAVAKVGWAALPQTIKNWRAEYFNNTALSGEAVLIRDDEAIDFNWGWSSPLPGLVNGDNFSVRWTRDLNLPSGMYRFTATMDDGIRLWVNGHLLVDDWGAQPANTHGGEIWLPGGPVPVKMEYYERGGVATARLEWSSLAAGDTVIVDNKDAGFAKGGSASSWHSASEGYNGQLLWTRNNDRARTGYNWARWYPTLKAGRYEVFVYIPDKYTTTAQAKYWVSHASGFASRVVDQSLYHDQWVSLGTYNFRGTRSDYVSLNDITGETRFTRLIAWDAVKWEPR